MNKKEYRKHLNVLELGDQASPEEIHRAYHLLKKLYTQNSIVTVPIEDELTAAEKKEILRQIEQSYSAIMEYLGEPKKEFKEEEAKKDAENEEGAKEEKIAADAPVKVEINLEEHEVKVEEAVLEEVADEQEKVQAKTIQQIESQENEAPVEQNSEEGLKESQTDKEIPQPKEKEVEIYLGDVPIEERKDQQVQIQFNEDTISEENEKETDNLVDEKQLITGISKEEAIPLNFKQIREKQGLSVNDIAVSTGIPAKVIANIETEKFQKLPDGGYLRWNIVTYAKALSIDSREAADQYMKKYRAWKSKK